MDFESAITRKCEKINVLGLYIRLGLKLQVKSRTACARTADAYNAPQPTRPII